MRRQEFAYIGSCPKNPKSNTLTCILNIQKDKPNLDKHIKACYNKQAKQIERIKEHKRKEKKKKGLKLIPQRKAFQSWFLTVPLSQIYSQTYKKVISNIKLKDQGQKRP